MSTVSVRYIVDDVDAAIAFYTHHLGFGVEMHPGPGFAMLAKGDLRLLLNTPGGGGGAGQNMPDGQRPEPGGWNRFQLEVADLDSTVAGREQPGWPGSDDLGTPQRAGQQDVRQQMANDVDQQVQRHRGVAVEPLPTACPADGC